MGLLEQFKTGMMETFEMSDLGVLYFFLGLEVNQGIDGTFISMRKYVEGLIKSFSMY